MKNYLTIDACIGNTPLVQLQRLPGATSNTILVKLEGDNPAGSVKDRPVMAMIKRAQQRGDIQPGDTLIEATSGNTGIALAMVAAVLGYKMILIMPSSMSVERRLSMEAYGAKIILSETIESSRDLAEQMQAEGKGKRLDQFANRDNPQAHYETTGPEIWQDTDGTVTHFISGIGTTGTAMGVSRYLKEKNHHIQIIGVQPDADSAIPGIRRWPVSYMPSIFEEQRLDKLIDISQQASEETMRQLAIQEGIFCGVSSGGNVAAALALSKQVEQATIVAIICDRGDRYLSTGLYGNGSKQ